MYVYSHLQVTAYVRYEVIFPGLLREWRLCPSISLARAAGATTIDVIGLFHSVLLFGFVVFSLASRSVYICIEKKRKQN